MPSNPDDPAVSGPRAWDRFDLVADWFRALPIGTAVPWQGFELQHGPWRTGSSDLYVPGACEAASFWWLWVLQSTERTSPAKSGAAMRFEALLPGADEPDTSGEWVLPLQPDMRVWALRHGHVIHEQLHDPSATGLADVPSGVFDRLGCRPSADELAWELLDAWSDDCVSRGMSAWVAEHVGRDDIRFRPDEIEHVPFFSMLAERRAEESHGARIMNRLDDGGLPTESDSGYRSR